MNKNLIFIVIDNLRKDFIFKDTIGFKKFAENGTFLDQLITHAPETFLSVGTYFTGLYPYKHKSGINRFENILSIFDYLRDTHKFFMQAYHTPFGSSFTINEYEKYFGYIGEDKSRNTMGLNPDISPMLDFLNDHKNEQSLVYLHFFTLRCIEDLLNNRVDFLCEQGRILEIIVAYQETIMQVDRMLEQLWSIVKDNLDKYLIVITADHGESYKLFDNRILGDTGVAWALHNGSRYEESINIPMILCGLDIPKNKIIRKQIRQIDIFPTLAKILKFDICKKIDGEAIVLDDNEIVEKPIFICRTSETFKKTLRSPDGYKLIYDTDFVELYDLKGDPKETVNLAKAMPEKVNEMINEIDKFFSEADFTKRDIISKYSGWERLSDNWQKMKDRFYQLNVDNWRYKAEKYDNLIGVSSLQYIVDIANAMHLNKNSKILEIGIGTGIISKYLLNFTKDVSGIDISPTMLALTDKEIKTYLAFADVLPFSNDTFDVIFGRQIYHNLNGNLFKAVNEAKRVLKSDGKFIIAEFIPPNDKLVEEWVSLRINKETRVFNTFEEITNVFFDANFAHIITYRDVIRCASLNNWLDNWCESEKSRTEVKQRFVSASEEYKKAINYITLKNDILFDMHYGIISGIKQ